MPIAHLDRNRLAQRLPSVLMEATVLDPPLTTEGWLRVEVEAQPGVAKLCPWMPRVDLDPLPGDAAVVIESDEGNSWVVQWWSQADVTPTPIGAGSKWWTGTTVPSTGLGEVGDFYLRSTTGDFYEKTGPVVWTLRGNLTGPTGATGPAGSTGPAGPTGPTGYDSSPIGSVITHTSTTAPWGYLLANGGTCSEDDYPDLAVFAAAEVAAGNPRWGISGVAPHRTITLPDLRDRFIYGKGAGAIGALGGASSVVLPNHLHSDSHTHQVTPAGTLVVNGGASFATAEKITVSTTDRSVSNTGNPTTNPAIATMPPHVVLAFFIKAKGVSVSATVIQGPTGAPGADASIAKIIALGG